MTTVAGGFTMGNVALGKSDTESRGTKDEDKDKDEDEAF